MTKKLLINSILSLGMALFLTACGGDNSMSTPSNVQDTNKTTDKPSLTINGAENISLIIGDTFTDPGAESTDTITVESDLNTSKAGTYTISYTATNKAGEKTTLQRTVTVSKAPSMVGTIPTDSNIQLGDESNILYYADPRPEENGKNRALRIDYGTMTYKALNVKGVNPHSIDRAGDTDKFYMRTQNSYSFDVVNFKEDSVKTVRLPYKPRAIGAYNKKYNLQLLSGKDKPVVGIIDVSQDKVIKTVGDQHTYNASQITSNAGSGSATGHALWLDENHFILIDRVNRQIKVYKVSKDDDGTFNFIRTSTIVTGTALHAVERVTHPKTRKDLVTFYALGEGDITKGFSPHVLELSFDSTTGNLSRTGKAAWLSSSTQEINKVKPTTHHAGISPDGKYLVAPVFDGKVYFIDRETMKVEKVLQAKLGAAHIEFSEQENIAIITNHYAQELTFIDMETLTVKKHLRISNHGFNPNEKHLLQPHFSYLGEDGRYFYTFATQDGEFLKIDLQTLEIVDRLYTGGAPEQAHS
jgi:hypothetical protein